MVHISDLVNKSKRIGGFAYPYLPILVNISNKHAPPCISQKHLVKPSYRTATVVIILFITHYFRVHGPGPYTCKCSQLA